MRFLAGGLDVLLAEKALRVLKHVIEILVGDDDGRVTTVLGDRDIPGISGQYVFRQPSRSGLGCPEACRLELFGEPPFEDLPRDIPQFLFQKLLKCAHDVPSAQGRTNQKSLLASINSSATGCGVGQALATR